MTEASVSAGVSMRLLLVDADKSLGVLLAGAMATEFDAMPTIVEIDRGRAAVDLLKTSDFDVLAADLDSVADLAHQPEDRVSKLVRAAGNALVLILCNQCSISQSLSAMRSGAHDCASRDLEGSEIVARIGALARKLGKIRAMTRSVPPPEAVDLVETPPPSIPGMRDLVLPMWRQEQQIIESAIQTFAGNISLAAAALELSPSTIYRKRQAWAEMDSRRVEMASAISAR